MTSFSRFSSSYDYSSSVLAIHENNSDINALYSTLFSTLGKYMTRDQRYEGAKWLITVKRVLIVWFPGPDSRTRSTVAQWIFAISTYRVRNSFLQYHRQAIWPGIYDATYLLFLPLFLYTDYFPSLLRMCIFIWGGKKLSSYRVWHNSSYMFGFFVKLKKKKAVTFECYHNMKIGNVERDLPWVTVFQALISLMYSCLSLALQMSLLL